MAKKKGKLTKGQKAKRERCVKELKGRGYDIGSAFAICGASVQKRGRKK